MLAIRRAPAALAREARSHPRLRLSRSSNTSSSSRRPWSPAVHGGRAAGSSAITWIAQAAAGGGAGSIGGSGSGGGGSGGSSGAGDGSSGGAHPLRLWTLVYAALLAVGGVAAFVTKGSKQSLTSAGGAALILALSARTMAGAQAKGSIAVCLALALLLSVVMGGRFSRTRRFMPAGLTAGVSVAMSAAYIAGLLA